MQAPDPRNEEDLHLLRAAALAAGPIALRHWKNAPEAWEKPDGAGPVSQADLQVNAALHEALGGARPEYGWLSEESPDDPARLERDHVFIIDPIDGTRAFLAGEKAFGLSLAVARAGRITAAVVHLPAMDLTYTAAMGGPAMRNDQVIRASTRAALEGASVLTSRASLQPQDWPRGLPQIRRSFRPSLAWRLCLAAEGRDDGMFSLGQTWEWDSAAGSLIAESAGCLVTDRLGQALRYNAPVPRSNGLVCAPAPVHGQIMAALTP